MSHAGLQEPLTSRCHALSTAHVLGNVGLIVGDRSALLVDAGADRAEGVAIVETASQLRPPRLVAYTHGHWDHVRGGVAMAGMEVVVHAGAAPGARDQLRLEDGRTDGPGRPTVIGRGGVDLDLGGVTVELIETPGHAPGSWSAWVPSEGVLYAGDTVVTCIPPVFADGDSATLERTLRMLAGMPIETLVPGHGRVVQGQDAIRSRLLARADLLRHVRDVALARLGPDGVEGVVAALPVDDVDPMALDVDAVPRSELQARHERLVRGILAELGRRPAG